MVEAPVRVLVCLDDAHGDCHWHAHPLWSCDDPIACPTNPAHMVAVYAGPVLHGGRMGSRPAPSHGCSLGHSMCGPLCGGTTLALTQSQESGDG